MSSISLKNKVSPMVKSEMKTIKEEIGSYDDSSNENEEENDEDDQIRTRMLQLKLKYKIIFDKFEEKLKATATPKNITNVLFIMTISVICFQQCYSQIHEYFKYSVRSQVSHSFPNSTLYLIPGVTVCNNNRLKISKLISQTPIIRDKLVNYMNEIDNLPMSALTEDQKYKRMRAIREIVENSVNITEIMIESPMSKLLDLASNSMIKDVNCNSLWGRQFNCENFRVIESYQAGACYTMFYLGSILEALSNELVYNFNTTLLGGEKKIDSFDEQEIADLLIDFEPHEHADFQRDVGGKVVIHSTGHIGSIRDMSYAIEPGKRYEIILTRRMTKRLPPPYKTMCVDYRSKNSVKFTDQKEIAYPSTILDTSTCNRNCIVKMTTKQCNCWPAEVPYFQGDPLIEGAANYRICPWVLEEEPRNLSEIMYVNCYKKFQVKCRQICYRGCWTEDYKFSVVSSSWPSKKMFLKANYDLEKKELFRLRSCCAKISLKYSEYIETRQIMYPSITLAQLASNVGGIVSGLIGVSAVTLYRYFTRKVLGCKVVRL